MTISYSARSHAGKIRVRNEDNLFANGIMLPIYASEKLFKADGYAPAPAIFAVCDGMGGEADGDVASRLAVETLLIYKDRIEQAKPRQLNAEMRAYVKSANESIDARAGNRAGTTLALALISERGVHCFNLGDSRIYYSQNNVLRQVTHDHTVDSERKRSAAWKKVWEQDKKSGPKLTRCIGIGDQQAAERYPVLTKDGRLLICSDGLTKMVDDAEIERLLMGPAGTADAADALLWAALEKGGQDNITVIVIDIQCLHRSLFSRFDR